MRKVLFAAVISLVSQVAVAQQCTNLCLQQVTCPGNGTTSVSGTVYMPNGAVPLPNALVYVPNSPVMPFAPGAACDACSPSGSPLVRAVSDNSGAFTLKNMPVGSNIPLVIQVGRWRRQVVLPSVTACIDTTVAASLSRLPKNKAEGDIPLTAVVTGRADQEECLLRQIGVADSEFTDPTAAGRINFFAGSVGAGAVISNQTPSESTLVASQSAIDKYDVVMMGCQGVPPNASLQAQQNFSGFLGTGGRGMLFHSAYSYLTGDPSLSSLVQWNTDAPRPQDPQTGYINETFADGAQFAQWLYSFSGGTLGQLQMSQLRHDFDAVSPPAVNLISLNDPVSGQIPIQFRVDTPIGVPAANQCGRLSFLDSHPISTVDSIGMTFPAECPSGQLTPQQLAAAYTLFDTSNCLSLYDRIFANDFEIGSN